MTRKAIKILLKVMFMIILITAITIVAFQQYKLIKEKLPSFEKAELSDIYPDINKEYTLTILEDQVLNVDNPPKIINDKLHLSVEFISEFLNSNFYWDEKEHTLTYTTLKEVIRMKTDELTYFVNDEPLELNLPITEIDNIAYIPIELFLKFDQFVFTYNEELDILIIDNPTLESKYADVNLEWAYMRTSNDKKSPYIKKLVSGEQVKIYGEAPPWYKVRTTEGYIGYIHENALGDIYRQSGKNKIDNNVSYENNLNNLFDGKVNLVWHQVTNVNANYYLQDLMKDVEGVDVLSPTWFEIVDEEGTVSNIADVNYVNWAHNNGYEVWALFKCFDSNITHEVLSSTSKRESVIKQILALSAIYNLDGINLDFENVKSEDGEYFVQFVKEISPYLKNQGLIVSVDMYVPSPWTAHYNREELGKVIDYLIIMGYDEHWSTSPVSGSVASIGFVDKGIKDTLLEVSKEKVILGLPYYTRLWIEETIDGQVNVSSKAYGMDYAYEILVENEAEIIWNDEVKQYYGEYSNGEKTYKIWLEDEKSIEEKVKLIDKYDIAGAAGWKLGLEKKEVWDVLKAYLKE